MLVMVKKKMIMLFRRAPDPLVKESNKTLHSHLRTEANRDFLKRDKLTSQAF